MVGTRPVTSHPYRGAANSKCIFYYPAKDEHCGRMEREHENTSAGIPVHATDTIPAVQAWDAYSAMVRDLIIRKSRGYGNAWRHQGYMGNIGRVLSKADRLKELMWRDEATDFTEQDVAGESVLDTLADLGPLAAFAIANIEEVNRWGR